MREFVVYDQPSPCPYLPEQTSRLPLRQQFKLSPRDFDERLSEGDRRVGRLLYRTQCPACNACEPIRIPVADFRAVRTHARVLKKGDAALRVRVGPPECDDARVGLYNRHKHLRDLDVGEGDIDLDGYYSFLVDSCCNTVELSYWLDDALVGVAISDRGVKAMSAVYCYFDPTLADLSLGTYNVLKQIELCRLWKIDFLYLGFYIAQSSHMNYKARYLPHERRLSGEWTRFDRDK